MHPWRMSLFHRLGTVHRDLRHRTRDRKRHPFCRVGWFVQPGEFRLADLRKFCRALGAAGDPAGARDAGCSANGWSHIGRRRNAETSRQGNRSQSARCQGTAAKCSGGACRCSSPILSRACAAAGSHGRCFARTFRRVVPVAGRERYPRRLRKSIEPIFAKCNCWCSSNTAYHRFRRFLRSTSSAGERADSDRRQRSRRAPNSGECECRMARHGSAKQESADAR